MISSSVQFFSKQRFASLFQKATKTTNIRIIMLLLMISSKILKTKVRWTLGRKNITFCKFGIEEMENFYTNASWTDILPDGASITMSFSIRRAPKIRDKLTTKVYWIMTKMTERILQLMTWLFSKCRSRMTRSRSQNLFFLPLSIIGFKTCQSWFSKTTH